MSRNPRRAILALVPVVALVSACGDAGALQATNVVGDKSGAVAILIDAQVAPAVACAVNSYQDSTRRGVKYGTGEPDQIAATVMDGEPTDAVVMPPGPALDRIRDELASPPLPFLVRASTTFWVAAVTDRGLSFTRFLAGRRGSAALTSAPCAAQRARQF